MRVLIIGGGRFLGRSFAEEALAHGDDVVVFNRGRTSVDAPGVTAVRGDRGETADVARLAAHGPWDAVIDTCASVPGVVGQNARTLAGQAGAYLFVSSVSAFADWPARPLRDGMPLVDGAPDATEIGHRWHRSSCAAFSWLRSFVAAGFCFGGCPAGAGIEAGWACPAFA